LDPFQALRGASILLFYPGFGISTAWAYQQLARFPTALNGEPSRARKLIALLQTSDLRSAGRAFYNSLEAPALSKYPLLDLFQEFLREHGAAATLMSGSGSTTFALAENESGAEALKERFVAKFGRACWTAVALL
jgi:4-diphosphocytidyl-2-C-methyl-D-erythritol kinase